MNYISAIFTARRQKKVLDAKDVRMRTMTETINSIKIIKLNSWIEKFTEKIKNLRDNEILMCKLRFMVSWVNITFIVLLPSWLILTVFSVAIKSGIEMKVSEAFAALQVLALLREPTRWLPFFIGMMMEFSVSMRRIQDFLQSEEINPKLVTKESNMHNKISVKISKSSFSWGGDKIDDEITKKNKEKEKKKESLKRKQAENSKNTIQSNSINALNNDSDEESKISISEINSESITSSFISTTDDIIRNEKQETKIKDTIVLKDIELTVKKGEFLCIIGKVGSGKSSLLNALMGDMTYVSDETLNEMGDKVLSEDTFKELSKKSKVEGIINISGSVSYVQQIPWIQNKTLRENILFGSDLDEDRYNSTIEKCQLVKDFEQLEGGDLTEIGEKGINLSGGQKARVSLARAVYSQKDIILMDDPISALDANTKKKIFDELFWDELKFKTRILVTHAVDFLEQVDRIAIMDHGRIKYIGTYDELKNNEVIQHIIEVLKEVSHKEEVAEELEIKEIELKRKGSSDGAKPSFVSNEADEDQSRNNSVTPTRKMSYLSTKGSKIISDEYLERIDADWSVYWRFFSTDWMWLSILLCIPIFVIYGYWGIQSTRYIGIWIDHIHEEDSYDKYLITVLLYSLAYGTTITLGFLLITWFTLNSSNNLHRKMVNSVLKAPINLYFDKTPTGKLLNRFSKDINRIDAEFWFSITFGIECFTWIGSTIFIWAIVSPFSLLCLPFAFAAGVLLIRYYVRSFREMNRIETVTNSPILSNFSETLAGTTTIRWFNKQGDFLIKNHKLVDDNLSSYFWLQSLNIWFSIRLQYISSFMMAVSLGLCVGYKGSTDPSTIGVVLIYLLALQGNTLWFFRICSEFEGQMVSYDRCIGLLKIPQEKFEVHLQPKVIWPDEGKIVFDNINLRYRPDTELVLKNLSFEIEGGQKVGVVGRTGAGKSTVWLALCRIIEAESGAIYIDNHDIKNLDLAYVRSKITIIPQDPVLFEGSIRFNLDPEGKCSDSEIERIVSKAALQDLWNSNKEIAANGENLSSGEKQLICICRAILRKNKIVLMDEATANIDVKTEEIIQKLINEEFLESTVITIAHRLNTILNSDKVLILEQGTLVHKQIDDFREYFQ